MNNISCDRCEATIITDRWDEPKPLMFVHETDDGFEQESRVLCDACEKELLDWIDDPDVDRQGAVDLPSQVTAARALHRVARDLSDLADELEDEL